MSNSSNAPQDREPRARNLFQRLRLILLSRTSLTIGAILLLGAIAGGIFLWIFIQRQLAPLVQERAARFGRSEMPPTATDTDRLTVEAVEASVNPWSLLFNRTLQLQITLVEPDVYLEQDPTRVWAATRIKQGKGGGGLKTVIESLKVVRGQLILVPLPDPGQPKGAIALQQVNGTARFFDENRLIGLDLQGSPITGGNLRLTGDTRPVKQQYNLVVAGKTLLADDISRLLRLKGLKFPAGRIDGNVRVKIDGDLPVLTWGNVSLNKATFKIVKVPQLFSNSTGNISFKGTEIEIDNVSTTYGEIPGKVNGTLDPKTGFNLTGVTYPSALPSALRTLNLKLPVSAAAQLSSNIRLTGPWEKPTLSGTAFTTDSSRIDKLNFKAIRADFQLLAAQLSITDIEADLAVGGKGTYLLKLIELICRLVWGELMLKPKSLALLATCKLW
jgi:translocation and assembly module TamB